MEKLDNQSIRQLYDDEQPDLDIKEPVKKPRWPVIVFLIVLFLILIITALVVGALVFL
jgi:hypothetical protein